MDEPITQDNIVQRDNKILVSFIGDSFYNDATYTSTMFDGSVKGKYVQSVIVNKILSLEEDDKVVIFRTDNTKVEKNYNNLKEQLDEKPIQLTEVIIEEGEDKDEVWSIFDKIYKEVIKFGNVYFDITYSFRSIPLFVSEILNFASTMHGSKVEAIYYAKDNGKDKYNIINLLPVVDIQKYTRLASDFKEYGRVRGVGEQYDDSDAVRKGLIDFDNYIQFNNLAKIKEGEYLREIFAATESDAESDTEIPLSFIKNELRETLRSYGFSCGVSDSYDSWDNIKAAILWCQDHDMFIQAFSLAREYVNLIVSKRVLEKYNSLYDTLPIDTNDVNSLTVFALKRFDISGIMGIVDKINQGKDPSFVRTISNSNNQFNVINKRIKNILGVVNTINSNDKTRLHEIERHIEAIETQYNEIQSNLNYYLDYIVPSQDVTFNEHIKYIISSFLDETDSWLKKVVELYTSKDRSALVLTNMRNNLDHCKSDFSQNDYIAYKSYNFKALFNLLPPCS